MKKVASWLVVLCIFAGILAPVALAGVNDCIGLEDGAVYYIKNLATNQYLDVEWGYTANLSNVGNHGFGGTANQQWKLERVSGWTYRLIPMHAQDMRLDVTGTNVDIYTYSSAASCLQFTISVYSGQYVMAQGTSASFVTNLVSVADSGNNVCIRSFSSPEPDSRARWSFEKVQKEDFDFYSFNYSSTDPLYPGINTSVTGESVRALMSGIYPFYNFTNMGAASAYSFMQSDGIWVFEGHGLKSPAGIPMATVKFFDSSGGSNGHITASTAIINGASDRAIGSLSANALAKERCIIYMGCSTGISYGSSNLVDTTFAKGAHFVLGTKSDISVGAADLWLKGFFDKAKDGGTIEECIIYANGKYNLNGVLYYQGDNNAKLK